MEKAVRDHFKKQMSKRIQKLISAALADLYGGPCSYRDVRDIFHVRWSGYQNAISELEDWWASNGGEVWYDTQSGFVVETEPLWAGESDDGDGWPEDWVFVRSRDAARLVFGALITDGGM
jgi:hypothetical protein